jgi:hypothetical protein
LAFVSVWAASKEALLERVARAEPAAVAEGYRKYMNSTNVSDRQELREVLETTLDADPALLLRIPKINVESFCDGSDIAADFDGNTFAKKIDYRVALIQSSKAPVAAKLRCKKALVLFKTCAAKKNF